jgi:O-antigen ligase
MAKTLNKNTQNVITEKYFSRIIIFASIITLYFNTNLQDPFNSPKMWLLLLTAGWLSIYTIPPFYKFSVIKQMYKTNKIFIILTFFTLSLLASALASDLPFTSFNGAAGRRLGFLTYLALSILLLGVAKYSTSNTKRFYLPILILSSIFVFYGFLQANGNDFIKWNNPYNSVILTFGNPNFASAMLAIFATVLIGGLFEKDLQIYVKSAFILVAIAMLVLIKESDSRQGFITILIAVLIQLCFYLYFRSKVLAGIFIFLSTILVATVVAAMLQIGPLTDLIYKRSVSVRGYYWRAALEMFRDYPLFGVGLDRYGDFFKEYREVNYSLNFGFEITSTNAHNVPLQLLSTGGIFVGVSYLLLIAYITFCGYRLIKKAKVENRNFAITLFSAWIAFQAQSIISIDNIGLTVWGWIFGGMMVGLYQKTINNQAEIISESTNKLNKDLSRQLLSYLIILGVAILCSFDYRSETSILQQRSVYNPSSENNRITTEQLGIQMKNMKLVDPFYRFNSSTYLITSGFQELGFQILDELIEKDPRNLDYLNAKAGYSQQLKDYTQTIEIRKVIEKYDPWNARNILILGENYKLIGDFSNMTKCLDRILSFAQNNSIAVEAKEKLTNG